ncbi:unnamed protein product [Adineta steineri]|nr:unnamed protein product [Adineta steineri]
MDLTKHQQILNDELNYITNEYNEFKQRINEQKQNPQNHLLINQIDEWERNSIGIIQQKAEECRKIAMGYLPTYFNDINKKFNDLSGQIKQIHQENEFNEINLNYLRHELIEITQELNNSSKIFIKENSHSFINEISIILSAKSKFNKWKQNAITVAGGNRQGQRLNVIVDQQNHSIIIADHGNRRVIRWLNQNQEILIQNIHCWGLAIDKNGFLYVSDWEKHEVRRWKMEEYKRGIIVAGGNGKGDQLNQFNFPTFIFVDEDQSVYVSDTSNHRVMKWRKDATEGIVVAGGNGQGENLNQLSSPHGVIVDDLGQIYVADCWNDRVMRWCEGKAEGEIIVGGNGLGYRSNQLNRPRGLFFDDEKNLYVADFSNHRIEKFEIIL